uniref:probable glycerol-3-phosphate acyltransferase 8 n=1 Tax=Erigeron canadensis TaxID=72917 RepID=UPI001CB9308E|nr:probable glycerol-3-phosphate acyltransferase 8 [Erigeron canadensis]
MLPKNFPPISQCNLSTINHRSIAADLDGTLLKATLSFPYYILLAIEAGSLFRGLLVLLSIPIIAIISAFISEDLAGRTLIFLTFSGIKVDDIEDASRSVLPRFYAADVRRDSFQIFDSCEKKVIVTANPVVMVETFVKECLGGDKVLGTELEIDFRTNRATGFVAGPGFMIGQVKKFAVVEEFGDDLPDIGIGDRKTDHDFMSICKEGYMVPRDQNARVVSPDGLKTQLIFHDGYLAQHPSSRNTCTKLLFKFIIAPARGYFNFSLLKGIVKCSNSRMWSWL